MDADVIVEGGEFLEAPPTVGAGVWLLVSVVLEVLVVGLLEGEGFAALRAAVGGLAWAWKFLMRRL